MNGVEVVKPVRKSVTAASREDVETMVSHIAKKNLEPGYPCQHRKLPLYVVGDNQGSTWKQLHAEYEIQCKQKGVRVFSCNRYREYVQHHLPGIKLNKTNTDQCNQCFSIALKLKDPNISEEEKDELKEQLQMHLTDANIQRRAINAFVAALRKVKATVEPRLEFEPCHIPDVQDQIR